MPSLAEILRNGKCQYPLEEACFTLLDGKAIKTVNPVVGFELFKHTGNPRYSYPMHPAPASRTRTTASPTPYLSCWRESSGPP